MDSHEPYNMNDGFDFTGPDLLRYEFIRNLGRGSFGQVKLYRRLSDGLEVAVKFFISKSLDVITEIKMLQELSHTYIVRYFDSNFNCDPAYMLWNTVSRGLYGIFLFRDLFFEEKQ